MACASKVVSLYCNSPLPGIEHDERWHSSLQQQTRKEKRGKLRSTILIYTAWNLWKELNRHIFAWKSLQPAQVVLLIKEEMMVIRQQACLS
ncbi:hypothetical protein PAHAL_2G227200 [Panicum hallii]|uniref:Reverse transcriptase zinc-binding domain-containing protein n=1 Tax=Panicum hallii TaxID=206008 RepID=A0A2T8KQ22_9POAL|nr:hypothetical protein PAHAL_2G227200 [Panicum hallii]